MNDADRGEREQRRHLQPELARREAVPDEARRRLRDARERPADRCQPARRYGATGRSSGLSSCAAIHAFVLACSSGLRCSRIRKTIADDERDHEPEREQAARHPRGELVERAPEHVAEHAERRRPQPGAEHVVGQELAQRHMRRAGDERRDRAHEPDEAADQDRHPAAPLEERLDLLQPLLGDLHPRRRAGP